LKPAPRVSFLAMVVIVVLVAGYASFVSMTSGVGMYTTQSNKSISKVTGFPFENPVFLSTEVGPCTGSTGVAPCFGGRATAMIFNCLSAAATTMGCTEEFVSGSSQTFQEGARTTTYTAKFQITIWYPHSPSPIGQPWTNCGYTESGDRGTIIYAYCITSNSTAFLVSKPGPPVLH
jgi:hypothetical protein